MNANNNIKNNNNNNNNRRKNYSNQSEHPFKQTNKQTNKDVRQCFNQLSTYLFKELRQSRRSIAAQFLGCHLGSCEIFQKLEVRVPATEGLPCGQAPVC